MSIFKLIQNGNRKRKPQSLLSSYWVRAGVHWASGRTVLTAIWEIGTNQHGCRSCVGHMETSFHHSTTTNWDPTFSADREAETEKLPKLRRWMRRWMRLYTESSRTISIPEIVLAAVDDLIESCCPFVMNLSCVLIGCLADRMMTGAPNVWPSVRWSNQKGKIFD